ncbi:MAG: rhodanese-like domain-containing protein [Betaproteobacteria bacterium]|nr:rhodanese-like domain-containing protein [Betaproteobacteria bacterium]
MPRDPLIAPGKEAILPAAAQRAQEAGWPYAGAVTPHEAWTLVREAGAHLIDTRTEAEYHWVGRVPDTPLIPWKRWPAGAPGEGFVETLSRHHAKDDLILLLCRSGVRSHHAAIAAARAGFTRVFNVLEGFEGDRDAREQRGHVNGWRHHGLPWVQD